MLKTDLKELPPRTRGSKYDELLDVVDGNVVALVRGTDYDAAMSQSSLRSALLTWSKHRGVKIRTSAGWEHPESGEPSQFRIDGQAVPSVTYVKVESLPNAGSRRRAKR